MDRRKQIEEICRAINESEFGGENGDAVTYLGSRKAVEMERFSCGCPELDDAMGGGYPIGRFIELYGPEASGKTSLALHAIAEFQKKFPDRDVALVDVEFSFDENYASKLGVKTEYLIVHQPDHGDQALNVIIMLLSLGVKLIVVDSVAALTTREEMEGAMDGSEGLGAQARLMSRSLRRLASVTGRNKATVIWTNQIREKIGIQWGDKTTTPGGRALRFYSSIRIHIARIGSDKEKIGGEDVIVSNRVRADVRKNKTAAPFKKTEFNITFGHGIDRVAAILDGALAGHVVDKSGAWFSYKQTRLGQGRAKTLDFLRTNDAILGEIEAEMIAVKEGKSQETSSEGVSDNVVKRPVTSESMEKLGKVTVNDV